MSSKLSSLQRVDPGKRILRSVFVLVALTSLLVLLYNADAGEPPFSVSEKYLNAVGPVRAQEVALKLSKEGKLTDNGHTFLHLVGEYIYDTYGPTGIVYCRPYFDHACYNGFTMHIDSLDTLEQALAECGKVDDTTLGGCMHGAGHAALFLQKYDVPGALQLCSNLAKPYFVGSVRACAFGVYMENAYPGVDALRVGNNTWRLKKDDDLFPCSDARIEEQYAGSCWRMQMVVLSNSWPIADSIALCSGINGDAQQAGCFRGLADGYVRGPNISVPYVLSACGQASGTWKNICLLDFVERNYLNGHDDAFSKKICEQIDASAKEACVNLSDSKNAIFSI